MPKAILIGKKLNGYKRSLNSVGLDIVLEESPSSVVKECNSADLLILENTPKGVALRELLRASKGIPKLLIFHDKNAKSLLDWLRESHVYPLYNPSESELSRFAIRLIKEFSALKAEQELKKELEIIKKEIKFYEDINKLLTSTVDINKILIMIMKRVKELTSAGAWSILMVDLETGDLVFENVEGVSKKKIKKFRLKPGEGIAGWVAQTGIPVVVPDVSKDPRFSSRIDKATHYKTKTLMCVPIKSKDQTLAVLEIINKTTGEPFTENDLNLLLKFVNQAALALEHASLYQKMEELVITDDLTKLFNTRYLNRTIETEVIRSNRYHTSVSLIFMDIDYFKHINDNYGHLVGSKVLVEMGQLLINQLRTIDIVARYGGDEFVMVLPQTSPADAVRIAERIRKSVEQNVFLKKEGYNLRLTSSFGVASYPESAKSKEELLRVADEAMYRVKHSTRNGVFAII